jgi:hypothetical protein
MGNTKEPDVVCADDACLSYAEARLAWEAGEFSEWVAEHGWPIKIAEVSYSNWTGVEAALSDDRWDA